jgi:hypothetical protein
MEGEFGTGLRAHIERTLPPDDDPERREEGTPTAEAKAQIAALLTELEERERAVAAAEAGLAYRERRLLDREAALVVASQKVSAAVVEQLLQTTLPVDDELARARARRRRGNVA